LYRIQDVYFQEVNLAKEKKKEDLKEFTVGSVKPAGAGKAKAPKAPRIQIREKDYPAIAGLIKGQNLDTFRQEAAKVLTATKELVESQDDNAKAEGLRIQKAYALSLALLDNSKLVK
jgi:hypothetical protein